MNPILRELKTAPAALIQERARPDFQDVFVALARRASGILTAVTRLRLNTLGLTDDDLARLRHVRVIVSEVNAIQLDVGIRDMVRHREGPSEVELWTGMLERGILEIRSAPLGGWSPDFTVFVLPSGPSAVLLGFHSLERPYPHRGPALASLHGPPGARLAEIRHRELWEEAHDIGHAVWDLLRRARKGASFAVPSG
jgi:hypothetical protein